jgi:hypothetical protein
MPVAEARESFAAAGLTETLATEGRAPFLGAHYRAVWTKPPAFSSTPQGLAGDPS